MKRIVINLSKLIAIIISVFGLFVSCQEEIEIPEESMVIAQHFKQVTFEAVSGDGTGSTRTIRNEDGSLSWLPNDEINVFCGQDFSGRFISDNTEIADRTTFTGHFNAEIPETSTQDYWAVYPYQSTNSSDGNSVTLTVPSVQVSSPGTFGARMYPSVAKSSSTSLAFYNVCGSIKFSLSRNDIDMITLVSNGDEPLAGSVRVTFGTDGKPVAEALEGVSEVTLRPSSGNCFEQGVYYYMTVLPVTMSHGFTMTFHTIDGEEGTLESSNAVTIRRSASSKRDNIDTYATNWHETESGQDYSSTGVYLGILAFNQALYTCPVSLLTSESLDSFKSFVDGLQMKNGTILYYAADQGLSNLQQGKYPINLSSASIITFTDGLDQGSLMMNPDYETEDKYLSAVSSRIRNGNVFGIPLSAFSIGIRGSDVRDSDKFRNNLVKLASSEQNAYEISGISDLNTRFENLASNVELVDYCYDLNLSIPGLSDGTKVRFTFDDVDNPNNSDQYIEGTFNLRSRSLSNVVYSGLSSLSGSSIQGVEEGIYVKFLFSKVRRTDQKEISLSSIKQWQMRLNFNGQISWSENSEFRGGAASNMTELKVGQKSAVIYLVLDCSSSLGDQFIKLKQSVKSFIQDLYDHSFVETKAQSIIINSEEEILEKGDSVKLSAMVSPATALDKRVQWSSSNPSIATVDDNGLVTAISPGITSIKAYSIDGHCGAGCVIRVYDVDTSHVPLLSSQTGLYLGIIAFNQTIHQYPISRLTKENVNDFCTFLDGIPARKGSLLYYSVDKAISEIQAFDYPKDLSYVKMITISDSFDQGSFIKQDYYLTKEDYLEAINQKINYATINSVPINATSVYFKRPWSEYGVAGMLGVDSSSQYLSTDYSSTSRLFSNRLKQYTYISNLTVTIPGLGNGSLIRFTFDDINDASQSNQYIEGVFNLSTRQLTNIQSKGFSSELETTIDGEVNGIFVSYSFNGLQKSDNTILNKDYLKEWTMDAGQSAWQINSEFNRANDATIETHSTLKRLSGLMYLVIDYSTSIGIDYYSINSCTKDFLKDLVNKTDDPSLVSSIKLNSNSLVLWPKRLYALKADISPKTAENQTVVWSSSAPSVATVSSSGLVEAVGLGSCTITVTTIDGGYSDSCNVTVSEMPIAEAVDLGLSVKWASFNLGAADSSHYGDKIAWGEVEPKTDYRWSTYKWCNGSASSLTKYNTKSSWGTVDNKTVLDPEDDAATVNWGDNWRTPTYSEMLELRQKCSWDYLMVGEVPCFKVTSKQPGYTNRFIIIPGRGVDIYYASSLLDSGTPWAANYFSMDEDESPFSTTSGPRCMGVYIRPVCDK